MAGPSAARLDLMHACRRGGRVRPCGRRDIGARRASAMAVRVDFFWGDVWPARSTRVMPPLGGGQQQETKLARARLHQVMAYKCREISGVAAAALAMRIIAACAAHAWHCSTFLNVVALLLYMAW